MTSNSPEQILKTRDDPSPVRFHVESTSDQDELVFRLSENAKCSWAKAGEDFGPEKTRPRIEPWLTALFQSEHLSVLVGSGLTHAIHRMATGAALPGMATAAFTTLQNEITSEAERTAKAAGRSEGNIEDQIRVANELLRGLEIIAATKADDANVRKKASELRQELQDILGEFAASILKGEAGLISAEDSKLERSFNYAISFLMSFASRSGTRDRLHLFTTNYDRYIETTADIAGLRLVDRFVGALTPIFRSSRLDVDMHYNPPGIRGEPRYLEGVARFTKLHGSVDWVDCDRTIRRIGLPFGAQDITPYMNAPDLGEAGALKLMIYPNASKDRETASYPYVELFRDFAAATCRPNSTLVCYGYSFGDEHINRVIEDMLTIPSAHLVIMSYDDPLGRIMGMYESLGRPAQVTLLIGDHLGNFQRLVDQYLPKPAIDRTTFRMAELLKARWGTHQNDADTPTPAPPDEGGQDS